MAQKKPTEVTPAALFRAAINKAKPENGYQHELVAGSDGRLKIVRAPDGHYFADWGNGGNPKNNIRITSVDKARALKADIDLLLSAVEVADELNKDAPVSNLASKTKPGVSAGISLTRK